MHRAAVQYVAQGLEIALMCICEIIRRSGSSSANLKPEILNSTDSQLAEAKKKEEEEVTASCCNFTCVIFFHAGGDPDMSCL